MYDEDCSDHFVKGNMCHQCGMGVPFVCGVGLNILGEFI